MSATRSVKALSSTLSVVFFLSLFCVPTLLHAQNWLIPPGVFQDSEKLTYKVKWGFLRLGTIVMETRRSTENTEAPKYRVQLEAESSLPVFKFHRKSMSVLNLDLLFSEDLLQWELEDGDTIETRVLYDREMHRSTLVEQNRTKGRVIRSLEKENATPYLDAISMWFFARTVANSARTHTIQTLRDFEIQPAQLSFHPGVSEVDVGVFDESVQAVEMIGAIGSAGQSAGGFEGDFRAWFSDDAAAVLLRAEMKIAVGKIKIELESWEREGWNPPLWEDRKLAKR